MNLNKHHITYEPEWCVELQQYHHKCVSIIQRTGATEERYALLTNFMHSLAHEWNRMREELDTNK